MRFSLAFIIALVAVAAAQVASDPKLRQRHDTYHPVTELLTSKTAVVTDEQLDQLKQLPFEAIWAAARSKGYSNHYVGLKPTRPEARLVGRVKGDRSIFRTPVCMVGSSHSTNQPLCAGMGS